MLRRLIFMSLAIMSGAISFVSDFGGGIVMGANKEALLDAYEQAGVDVSACKDRPANIIDPSGGMPECLERTFKDIKRKFEAAEADKGNAESDAESDAVGEPELE